MKWPNQQTQIDIGQDADGKWRALYTDAHGNRVRMNLMATDKYAAVVEFSTALHRLIVAHKASLRRQAIVDLVVLAAIFLGPISVVVGVVLYFVIF